MLNAILSGIFEGLFSLLFCAMLCTTVVFSHEYSQSLMWTVITGELVHVDSSQKDLFHVEWDVALCSPTHRLTH